MNTVIVDCHTVAYFVEPDHQLDSVPFYNHAYAAVVELDSYLVLPLYHLVMAWLGPLEDVTVVLQHHQLMDDLNSYLEFDSNFVNALREDVLLYFADL